MTIFLVLGLFAGLYMIWLLFSLAIYALPVGAGIALALWMRDQNYGYIPAIFGGFAGGVAIYVVGQLLFALIRSPIARLAIALLFAVPAGIAGYHAVQGVIGLVIDPGTLLSVLSWVGAAFIAITAWIRVANFEMSGSTPDTSAMPRGSAP